MHSGPWGIICSNHIMIGFHLATKEIGAIFFAHVPGLHIHRVVYGSHGGKYELNNCVLLCGEDHAKVHSSKVTWAEKLLNYLANPNRNEHGWLMKITN